MTEAKAKAAAPKAEAKAPAKSTPARSTPAKTTVIFRSTGEEPRSFVFMRVRGKRNPSHPGKVDWEIPKSDVDRALAHHLVITGRIERARGE